jgi:hypothetical protein
MKLKILFYFLPLLFVACADKTENKEKTTDKNNYEKVVDINYDTTIRTAHILVALCDNKYQGIVPVPAAIGNGEDLNNNLYWGCSYGIRSYFKNSKEWLLIRKTAINNINLERLLFKNKNNNFYLICDAYKGQNIKECTIDFLNSCSGKFKDTIKIDNHILGINGNAKLLAYIGHDGLMDFKLNETFENMDNKSRDVVILACRSKKYYSNYIQQAKANPLLWTSDLMCPEAYTIHDLLSAYIKNDSNTAEMNLIAAKAYSKYQKCSVKSAQNLLVSGF